MSFSKLFDVEYHLQAVFKPLDFLREVWCKKGESKEGKAMREKVFGNYINNKILKTAIYHFLNP